jgi:uncharacterized protein
MTLEWIRRRDPALDAELRKFLFTSEPITEVGAGDADGDGETPTTGSGSLGIGSLKGVKA